MVPELVPAELANVQKARLVGPCRTEWSLGVPYQCLWVGIFPSDSSLQKQTRALYARVDFHLGHQALFQKTQNHIGNYFGLWARPGSRAMRTLLGDLQRYHAGIALETLQCASVHPPTSGLVA